MSVSIDFCCPACHSMTAEGVGNILIRCMDCGLAVQPTVPEFSSRKQNQDSWSTFWHDYAVGMMRIEQTAKHLPRSGLWVDFGCGNGAGLAAARDAGFETLGVELDAGFCQEVLVNTGTTCCPTTLFFTNPASIMLNSVSDPNNSAAVLSLFDVLHQVADPVGVLKRAIASVEKMGRDVDLMVLEVPDLGQAPKDISKWRYLKGGSVVTHWSRQPLDAVGEDLGFQERSYQTPVKGKIQAIWKP